MEVQTRLWNDTRTVFMRLEQFAANRLPLGEYNVWRESSHGAYSNYVANPDRLEKMSTAAFCWMFALRRAFEDSGWAEQFARQDKGNYVGVLGFETNNIIHDDNDGRGPHFHIGLRSSKKSKERNPAFYMDPDDGSVSQKVYNTQGVELTASGIFGVLRMRGELVIGPLIRLRNRRTGMYLYVRESEQGPTQGLFQTSDGEMGDNVAWLLVAVSNGSFLLCSVRSNCVAAAETKTAVDALIQTDDLSSQLSQWRLEPSENGGFWRVVNVASGHNMYGFFKQQALPIAQFNQSDDGSEWQIERKNGDLGWEIISSALPPTYSFKMSHLQLFQAELDVKKNGARWATVHLSRAVDNLNSRVGIVSVQVKSEQGADASDMVVRFDRLTGKELGQ